MMPEPRNIIGTIISAAIPVSRSIAQFLSSCEAHLSTGSSSNELPTAEELLSHLSDWRRGPYGLGASVLGLHHIEWDDSDARILAWENRLASITIQAWSNINRRSGKRPDVLALTASLLSNPEASHTYAIVRYALILALRSLYGVENEPRSLEHLSESFSHLASRLQKQKRRRVLKESPGAEPFLVDLLCMEGYLYRAALGDNLALYHEGFLRFPFGVDVERRLRHFAERGKWPEIHGAEPDFATVLNVAFNQPLGVPGLDDIIGGLMPTMAGAQGLQPGGIITLLAGPPGSGKTTMAMSIGSRMAELGSQVVYLSAEESMLSLGAKRLSVVDTNRLAKSLWPDATIRNLRHEFQIVDGGSIKTLRSLVDRINEDVRRPEIRPRTPGDVFVDFPYVVIVDSITVLLGPPDSRGKSEKGRNGKDSRQELASLLRVLRDAGVCVILIGEKAQMDDHHLAYLVDNVLSLDFEEDPTARHPLRILCVEKTRLQLSFRGRHVFHLSRFNGPTVSPSLHAVLRMVGRDEPEEQGSETRAVLWASAPKQEFLPGMDLAEKGLEAITIRGNTHSLIYGWGTTGKARLALSVAFEPQIRNDQLRTYIEDRAAKARSIRPEFDIKQFDKKRVLVISFLYGREYYSHIADDILRVRSGSVRSSERNLTIEALYPGFLDPESLVNRVRKKLATARHEGRPFQSVVIDGIHNMLLQFPLLARETLLWPTIFRVLRSERVSAISTFTFFQVAGADRPPGTVQGPAELMMVPNETERMFHHLLVSNCDNTFLVARNVGGGPQRKAISVQRTAGMDGFGREPTHFFWDSERLECWVDDAA